MPPHLILRTLGDDEMAEYRRPFAESGGGLPAHAAGGQECAATGVEHADHAGATPSRGSATNRRRVRTVAAPCGNEHRRVA